MSNNEKAGLVGAVIVTLFALWFRLEYQATTLVDVPMRADAGQYVRIGKNLVQHGVVSMDYPSDAIPNPDSYRGPGYPLLVASALLLGGEKNWYHFLLATQAVLGALSVMLTLLIARRWLPWSYTIAAGLLVAIWPHSVTLSGIILTETFFGFTLLLATYLLCRGESSGRSYWYALAGLVFAYSTLINPSIVLFPVLIGAFFFFTRRKYALLFLLCTVIVPLAWSVRGTMLDSERTTSGRFMENVLVGMEPDFSYLETPAALAARTRVTAGLENYRQNPLDEMRSMVGELAEQPAYYLNWYLLQKPLRFWQWSIVHGDGDIYVYPVIMSPFHSQPVFRAIASVCSGLNIWLMAAAFCTVLLVASAAARRNLQSKDIPLVYVALLFVYATALHTLLTPDPRYSTPYRPFEILLALSFVALLHQRWHAQKSERLTGIVRSSAGEA